MKLSPCKALLLGSFGTSSAGFPLLEPLYTSVLVEVAEHVSLGRFYQEHFERFMENSPETPMSA